MNEETIKRMKTIMIGSIAAIEKRFGHLFGQDKREGLSKDEIEMKKLFLQVRNDILDLGNKEISKLQTEQSKENKLRFKHKWRVK